MSTLSWVIGGQHYSVDLNSAQDISIAIDFDGAHLQAFGAAAPTATPLQAGQFIGDVRRGGSCNCLNLHLTPHCHGTHTESVGHLTTSPVPVAQLARQLYLARLITVHADNQVISLAQLQHALVPINLPLAAVVVRTLPNPADKLEKNYDATPLPAWFAADALAWLAEMGVEHLLVDVPSVDCLDDPHLLAHRAFWGLPAGCTDVVQAHRPQATITELIYVPDHLADGHYVLNLQVAPLNSDAAPSRPLLYPLTRV